LLRKICRNPGYPGLDASEFESTKVSILCGNYYVQLVSIIAVYFCLSCNCLTHILPTNYIVALHRTEMLIVCMLWQCAILSPNFRVRDFAIADAQPYPINLSWQGAMDDEGQVFLLFNVAIFISYTLGYYTPLSGSRAKYM